MTELFPASIRGTAQGFCYNFGRGISALFPGVIRLLGAMLPLGGTIVAFGVGAYAIMLVAVALLPETARSRPGYRCALRVGLSESMLIIDR